MGPSLLKSKLSMPKLDGKVLFRPVLRERLSVLLEYPVTVITAGAGYGKTTALLQILAEIDKPCGWYSPGPEDDNVYIFSMYLAAAVNSVYPGFFNWYAANIPANNQFNWKSLFSAFSAGLEFWSEKKSDGILVIDDWFLVQPDADIRNFIDRLIACKPQGLHLVLLSREEINLPEISRLRAGAKLLTVDGKNLVFSCAEIRDYINQNEPSSYSEMEIIQMYDLTEGWVMAIRMMANLRGKEQAQFFPLNYQTDSTNNLFSYLASDVLDRQPEMLQKFLLKSALVETISAELCQAVLGKGFRVNYLSAALCSGLFLSEIGHGIYRYHQLFREFLLNEAGNRLSEEELSDIHFKAGQFYLRDGKAEQALQHFVAARKTEEAAAILAQIARLLVQSGKSRLLHSYLQQLSEVESHPKILLALGDEARFACQYKQAQYYYQQAAERFSEEADKAGESSALRGRGEIYLDIIQPLEADRYLRVAYKTLPARCEEEKVSLINLLAENMINRGDSRRAARYRWLVRDKFSFSDANNFEARILLRTGKIGQAIQLMEEQLAAAQQQGFRIPCSFRERPLILSVCYSYTGQVEKAIRAAEQGIAAGEQMNSPFAVAVGYYRKAHALLLKNPPSTKLALETYRKSAEVGSPLAIPRSRTEILQGRCLIYALENDWEAARNCGVAGIEITQKVGDNWFTAILLHTLGMAAALCSRFNEAQEYLLKADRLFKWCSDTLGQTAVQWWLSYIFYHMEKREFFLEAFDKLIKACDAYHYEFLLKGPSLLGDIGNFSSAPFFQACSVWHPASVAVKPDKAEVSVNSDCINGVLDIRTLGRLQVVNEAAGGLIEDWKRENAKKLFCLLLTLRHVPVHKDMIMVQLWPEANSEVAKRNLKVALHTLLSVLEPDRKPRQNCRFIERSGNTYRICLDKAVRFDVVEFEHFLHTAKKRQNSEPDTAENLLQRAMSLYNGKFLEGEDTTEWLQREQEHLGRLFTDAGDDLTKLCIRRCSYDEALYWAERVTAQDPCWERSYQYMLWCYGKKQNSAMVARVYKRCCEVLREELGIRPSQRTREIYQRFI